MITIFIIFAALVIFVVSNQFVANNQNSHLLSKLVASLTFVSFTVLNINSLPTSSSSIIPYAILVSQLLALLGDLCNALFLTNFAYVYLASNFFVLSQSILISVSALVSVEQSLLPLLGDLPLWQVITVNLLVLTLVSYTVTYFVFTKSFNIVPTQILPPTDRLTSQSFFHMLIVIIGTIAAVSNNALQYMKVQDVVNAGQNIGSLAFVSSFLLKFGISSLLILINNYAVISYIFIPVSFLTLSSFRNYLYVRTLVYYVGQLLLSWSIVDL